MGGLEGGMTTSWEVFFEKGFVLNFSEKKLFEGRDVWNGRFRRESK